MKMSKTRLFVSKKLSANILIYIKNKQHHFLKNVLRIKKEDSINLFDGLTGEWLSKVISINRDNIVLRIQNKLREIPQESDLWLIFAPIKSYRMNITIQKATELGISRFIPILTEYTNQSKINFKNFELNIIEASEQSERLSIPTLDEIIKLDDLVNNFPSDRGLVFCDEGNENLPSIYNALINEKKNTKNGLSLLDLKVVFLKRNEQPSLLCLHVYPSHWEKEYYDQTLQLLLQFFLFNRLLNKL